MRLNRRPQRIFLSYRRDDAAGHAGRLHDKLVERFGKRNVFMDIDTIRPGEDFREVLRSALGSSDALVAVVGNRWLQPGGAEGTRRIDDPDDYVRLELETALRSGAKVVPVLVQGATMPGPGELPPSLEAFAARQAVDLSDNRWGYDVDVLVRSIEGGTRSGRLRSRRLLLAVGLLVLAAAAAAAALLAPRGGGGASSDAGATSTVPLPAGAVRRAQDFRGLYTVSLPADWIVNSNQDFNPIDDRVEGHAVRYERRGDRWSPSRKYELPAVYLGASATTIGRLEIHGEGFARARAALRRYLRIFDWSVDGCTFDGFSPYVGSRPRLRGLMTLWEGCDHGPAEVREIAAVAPRNRFFFGAQLFAPDPRFLAPEMRIVRSLAIDAPGVVGGGGVAESATPP